MAVDYLLVNELVERARVEGYQPDRLDNAIDVVCWLRREVTTGTRAQRRSNIHDAAVTEWGLTEEGFFLAWVATAPRRPPGRKGR